MFRNVLVGLVLFALCGCNLPTGLPKEFAQVADVMAGLVRDQGVLDNFTSNIDGNIQNPGLETYVSIRTTAGVRIVGVNGEVDLGVEGTGTQLPRGVRDSLITMLGQPIGDEQRAAILEILGWNRTGTVPP